MKKQRLVGVELCRGIAAYAVVLLHSGDQTWAPVGYWASQVRTWFSFPVPFFLAVSFYFTIRKLPVGLSWNLWKRKFERLLIPYILWSAIYIFFKSLMFLGFKQYDKLSKLFEDPISLIFCGGSAIQLYYLPLLLAGTFAVMIIAEPLAKRHPRISLVTFLAILAITAYELLFVTGNQYQLGPNIAFENLLTWIAPNGNKNPLLRIILVNVAWMIRCIPYLLIAILLNRLLSKIEGVFMQRLITILSLLFFLVLCFFNVTFIHGSIRELATAYSLLVFSLYLSKYIKASPIAENLGACSFGIYLIHPFFIQIIDIIVNKINPSLLEQVSLISQIIFSVPGFLLSWIAVFILLKNKLLAKYLFGA
jgi:peptidoglycan/LPS O-acetylase OafA/YrhL